MADNRIYLKCKKCGEEFALCKYYKGTGWYTVRDDTEDFNKFLEHFDNIKCNHLDFEDGTCLEMIYEQDNDEYNRIKNLYYKAYKASWSNAFRGFLIRLGFKPKLRKIDTRP